MPKIAFTPAQNKLFFDSILLLSSSQQLAILVFVALEKRQERAAVLARFAAQ